MLDTLDTPNTQTIHSFEAERQKLFPAIQRTSLKIGDKTVTLETGRLARSASAAVTLTCDDVVILVTATGSDKPRPGIDFFPLLVDFEEKMFSVGRFPGGYLKKEGRPSEKAVLSSRLIDRPIRPLFPDGYRNDVQIVAIPLTVDSINQPDVLSILGASMALELSGLPFEGPIGAVRVGRVDGRFVLNPTFLDMATSDLDLIVAGTADAILMVEAGAQFVSESTLVEAMALAHDAIREQVKAQTAFREQLGIVKKPFVPEFDISPLVNFAKAEIEADVTTAFHNFDRDQRKVLLEAAKEKYKASLQALEQTHPVKVLIASTDLDLTTEAFKKVEKTVMRQMICSENVRPDGRKPEEIRPIYCEVGVLPRAHGSALFTRGSTQVLSIATLGSPGDIQKLDGVDPATEKRWIHHYNFPSFSVGEVRPSRGPGRREIGHGALAERAIAASLPVESAFPYAIRVNSEVLESNGSTSMASTCGSSLALMDAGVPLQSPIGGIAMGLIQEANQTIILSDIQGVEDFLGDMDFKVTGNATGVTALQMDMKIRGLSMDMMAKALEQARQGRLHILERMQAAIATPRTELSKWAPQLLTIKIDQDQIGAVIGPGGKNIRSIIEQTGTTIDIADDGTVTIGWTGDDGGPRARAIIEQLTRKYVAGMILMGKVVRILPIGAFVELAPGKDGMVHISQLAPFRVNQVEDVVNLDEELLVKITDVDERGRINLTLKGVTDAERAEFGLAPMAWPEAPAYVERPPRPEGDRGGYGGGRGGDRGGRGGGFRR
jgi:polyribonucleotide nucleotidyltransferase